MHQDGASGAWRQGLNAHMNPIWIVDDDASIRWVLEKALSRQSLACRTFGSADEALKALAADPLPQVLVSDIRMPGRSGLELLEAAKAKAPNLPVIIMTAYSDLDSAVSAFQGGAFEYLTKPFDVDAAVELIQRALTEVAAADRGDDAVDVEAPEILGHAHAMQELFRAIGRLSQSSATVLITGESGSGKELVARALHRHSPRSRMPFVALNTAAIPKDLLESELFGHERGAFTGAQALRRGRFEQAEGGTLFLDEIGDMPMELQTRLLRVLSDGHFYRVGGHQPLRANVRVIAATHQHLEARVEQGLFREDLFHRLNVIRLRLPPLRERPEDIPVLARHFLAKSAKELGVETKRLSDDALAFMARLPFPGNVRQLENLCHWMTVMAPAATVALIDLPTELRERHADLVQLIAGPQAAFSPASAAMYNPPSQQASTQAQASAPMASGGLSAPFAGAGLAQPLSGVRHDAGVALTQPAGQPGAHTPLQGLGGGAGGGAPMMPVQSGAAAGLVAGQASAGGWPMTGAGVPGLPVQGGAPTTDAAILAAMHAQAQMSAPPPAWYELLERHVEQQLAEQHRDHPPEHSELMDALSRQFEAILIGTALRHTRGRRIEAALRLGIGRNTITRKIAELRLEAGEDANG